MALPLIGKTAAWLLDEVFDIPLDNALERVMSHRKQMAREVLQKQLEKAEIHIADAGAADEAAAMIFEYIEAAKQGAARRNLRMLAEIMSGMLVTPPLYASKFLRWSHILADLSVEDIIALIRLHRAYHDERWNGADGKKDYSRYTEILLESLVGDGIFKDRLDAYGTLGALQRTGLVVLSAGGFGGAWYLPTLRLDELLNQVDIEGIILEPDR